MSQPSYRVAFDIGGTFTDFAMLEVESGALDIHKCLTTPADPSQGALDGLAALFERTGVAPSDVANAIHGTTLVTNALIERRGARVALLTTEGFRDVLEIRNEQRYDIYDLTLQFPDPIVPRYLRLGVDERTDQDGTVVRPPSRESVAAALDQIRTEDARDRRAADAGRSLPGSPPAGEAAAVAISFLHAYRNGENEEAAAKLVAELWPELDITTSSSVASEIREYERTSTAVANAFVRPVARRYLEALGRALARLGYRGRLYLMLSSGGVCTVETATRFPIQLCESGPAGGAIGAAHYGARCGESDLVSFDMGGTTAKIALIEDGRPAVAHQLEAARLHRFKKGSGLPLQVPSVEMIEIGAGGGSIAWVDGMGLLKVGPRSAGADPGPACYGRAGADADPTVTDADLVLGYLDPDYFLGGQLKLDRDAAVRAIETKVARPLGLPLIEAARGIHQLVNENMASAAKIHIIERGRDPRRYAMLAFGGAGPIHAAGVASTLGQPRVICPLAAGVLSAIGFLVAPVAFDFARSMPGLLPAMPWEAVNALFGELAARGREMLVEAGIDPSRITIERRVDARYAGQFNEIVVPLPDGTLTADRAAAEIQTAFERRYVELYGHLHRDIPIEFLTWRLVARGELVETTIKPSFPAAGGEALRTQREAYWPDLGGFARTPVYDRYALRAGESVAGPAIVEERESTALVPPGGTGRIDENLNLIIELPMRTGAPAGTVGATMEVRR